MAAVRRGSRRRVRLSREERLPLILQEARGVFTELGFEDASMAEVARRVGIVEGTIYRYFDHKRDLLIKVLEQWMNEAMSDYAQQLSGIVGSRNRLRFMIWHHLRMLYQDPALYNLLIVQVRYSPDYASSDIYALNRSYTQRTVDILREGIAEGTFRDDIPPYVVRDLIYGGAEFHIWRYMTGRDADFDVDAVADQISELVYRAIAVKEGPESVEDRLAGVARRLEAVASRFERGG
jgi:AcrR family transcriptional regulator